MYVVFAEEVKPMKVVIKKKNEFAYTLTVLMILTAVVTCLLQVAYQYQDVLRNW